jgi:hypothetical protein
MCQQESFHVTEFCMFAASCTSRTDSVELTPGAIPGRVKPDLQYGRAITQPHGSTKLNISQRHHILHLFCRGAQVVLASAPISLMRSRSFLSSLAGSSK